MGPVMKVAKGKLNYEVYDSDKVVMDEKTSIGHLKQENWAAMGEVLIAKAR